jgi:peptidoglycan/xylan/chitin deacetylase (PgdA/CDA1 family)
VILNFHGLGEPPAAVPAAERPYWVCADRFARIVAEVAARRARGQDIAITFDDGNRSDLEIAAPRLAEAGLSAAFFVLTGRLEDDRYLSRAQIGQLQRMGMEIGLHGRDHVDWRRLDESGRRAEIPRARAELAELLGGPVRGVAIPFGAYDRRVMSYLKREGFERIHTSDGGRARAGARVQPRVSLRSDSSEAELAALLDGTEPALGRLTRRLRRALKEHVV